MYLIDTNVLSELRRRDRADPGVIAWFQSTPEKLMAISVVTIAEIEAGVRKIERRDAAQGELIRRWAEGVFEAFSTRSLAIDDAAARICGGLHVPDLRPERDAWIAATAFSRDLTVVTRNVRDFQPMGVKTVDPWSA
jgi:toxin FitB